MLAQTDTTVNMELHSEFLTKLLSNFAHYMLIKRKKIMLLSYRKNTYLIE